MNKLQEETTRKEKRLYISIILSWIAASSKSLGFWTLGLGNKTMKAISLGPYYIMHLIFDYFVCSTKDHTPYKISLPFPKCYRINYGSYHHMPGDTHILKCQWVPGTK